MITAEKRSKRSKKHPDVPNANELVSQKYPEKDGILRRINHLWTGKSEPPIHYFRVNYINCNNGHILESYWVEVVNNEIISIKE